MNVVLKTSNGSNYFNVLPPGSKDAAIFMGSTEGNEWTGALPADGEYTIRVYLMRNAARRNETASYTLTVGIRDAAAAASTAPATKGPDSIERAGQGRVDATGNIQFDELSASAATPTFARNVSTTTPTRRSSTAGERATTTGSTRLPCCIRSQTACR